MKILNKITTALLILTILLSLSACGKEKRNDVFTKKYYDAVTSIKAGPNVDTYPLYLTDKEKINEFAEFMENLELAKHKEDSDSNQKNDLMGGDYDIYFFTDDTKIGGIAINQGVVYADGIGYDTDTKIIDKLYDLIGIDKVVVASKAEICASDFYNTANKIELFTSEKPYAFTDKEKITAFGKFMQGLTLKDVTEDYYDDGKANARVLIEHNDGTWEFIVSDSDNVVATSDAVLKADKDILIYLLELTEK